MTKHEVFKIALPAWLAVAAMSWASVPAITVTSSEAPAGSVAPGAMTLIKETISIPSAPKVGEAFEVTLTVTASTDMEPEHFGPDYLVGFTAKGAVVTQGARHQFSGYLKQGETRTFKATMLIESPRPSVDVETHIKTRGWSTQSLGFTMSLLDAHTGRYGLAATRQGQPPVQRQYNPGESQVTDPPPQGSVSCVHSSVRYYDDHRHYARGHHAHSIRVRHSRRGEFDRHHCRSEHGHHRGNHASFRVTIRFGGHRGRH